MKHSYVSNDAAKKAKKFGDEVVQALTARLIYNSSCKLDDTGHYGVFFSFTKEEVYVLAIDENWTGGLHSKPTGEISVRYRNVYRFTGGSRPLCRGLTLSKKLPSVESIVNNLKARHAKIKVAYDAYVQSNLEERVFNLESKGLRKEFPRFKDHIGGEPGDGSSVHSIHFDELPIGRARQILEILTKYLPVHYEVGEES